MDRAAVKAALFARLDPACANQQRQDLGRNPELYEPPLKRIARLEAVAPVMMAIAREAMLANRAAQAAAQLERAKRVAAPDRKDRVDMGTLVRRRRGELVQEDRADIDSDAEYKPTIRGARRRDPLREFLGIRNTHRPHDGAPPDSARRWTAAQAYRALVEIAGGAKVGDKPMERVDATAAPGGYTDRMLEAIGALRRIREALGADYPLIRWVVEEYSGIDEFAFVAGVPKEKAEERLLAGLEVMIDQIGGHQDVTA